MQICAAESRLSHAVQFTNLSKDFKGTLDYILYTSDSLVPCAVLDLPEEGDMHRQVCLGVRACARACEARQGGAWWTGHLRSCLTQLHASLCWQAGHAGAASPPGTDLALTCAPPCRACPACPTSPGPPTTSPWPASLRTRKGRAMPTLPPSSQPQQTLPELACHWSRWTAVWCRMLGVSALQQQLAVQGTGSQRLHPRTNTAGTCALAHVA